MAILNMFAPENKVSKYMTQKLLELQEEIYKSVVIVRNFNTLLSITDSSRRQCITESIFEQQYQSA